MSEIITSEIEKSKKNILPNILMTLYAQIKEASFKALYTKEEKTLKTNYSEKIEFLTKLENGERVNIQYRIGNMIFERVYGEKNGFFYVYKTNGNQNIEKFYIKENGKKELVKSMYGCFINFKGETYTRITTKESGTFYINIKNFTKLYTNGKLVNFLKEKKGGNFQIETY